MMVMKMVMKIIMIVMIKNAILIMMIVKLNNVY